MQEVMNIRRNLVEIQAEVYQAPLNEFVPQITKGSNALKAITAVSDQTSLEVATNYLNKAKTLSGYVAKKIEELCRPLKDMKADIDDVQRKIKGYGDEISKPINEAAQELQTKILAYHAEQKKAADAARKVHEEMVIEAEEKRRKEAAEAAAVAEEKGEEPPPPPPPIEVMTPVVEAPKIKGLTTIWKYEIEDPELIPRTYMTPDLAKINAAVKGGMREIPGVKIFSEQQIKKS